MIHVQTIIRSLSRIVCKYQIKVLLSKRGLCEYCTEDVKDLTPKKTSMGQLKRSGQGSRWPGKQAIGYLATRPEVHTCLVAKEKTFRSSSIRGVTCVAFFALVTCDPKLGQAYVAPRVPRQGLLRVKGAHPNMKVIQHVYHVFSPRNRWYGVSRSPQHQFLSGHTYNPQLSVKPPP